MREVRSRREGGREIRGRSVCEKEEGEGSEGNMKRSKGIVRLLLT